MIPADCARPANAPRVGGDPGSVRSVGGRGAERAGPDANRWGTEGERGFQHRRKRQASGFAIMQFIIRTIGSHGEPRRECALPDFAGPRAISVRHVNVAAPFNAVQSGLADQGDNFGG